MYVCVHACMYVCMNERGRGMNERGRERERERDAARPFRLRREWGEKRARPKDGRLLAQSPNNDIMIYIYIYTHTHIITYIVYNI